MLRYRLRTLLILLAVGPVVAASAWWSFVWLTHGLQGAEGFDEFSLQDLAAIGPAFACLVVLAILFVRQTVSPLP
jgi:hypothetical protein